MDLFSPEACGFYGGCCVELLGMYKLRKETSEDIPKWIKSPFYWIITVLMMLAGAGLVVLYQRSGIEMHQILAFNVGASAPLIIGGFASQVPTGLRID